LRARRRAPALLALAVANAANPPFETERWKYGYLSTYLHRDMWMHRLDISRAVGRQMDLTPSTTGA